MALKCSGNKAGKSRCGLRGDNTRGRAWGQLSPGFLVKHRKLPAAAKLIDEELLPQSGGSGNKQRQMLLAFTLVLPVNEMALSNSAT